MAWPWENEEKAAAASDSSSKQALEAAQKEVDALKSKLSDTHAAHAELKEMHGKAVAEAGELKAKSMKKLSSMSAEEARVAKLVSAGADSAPEWLKKYLKMAAPVIGWVVVVGEELVPLLIKLVTFLAWVYGKMPMDLLQATLGLLMCFFGGVFPTLIAAGEAFKVSGWDQTQQALVEVWEEAALIAAESKKDDDKDDDGDGVRDVDQMDAKALLRRKVSLFLTKCHPDKMSRALGFLYSACVGVAATLTLQFAKTIALGVAIGDTLRKPAAQYLAPVMAHVMPAEYHLWISVILDYACKSIALSLAWYVQSVISAFHSAIRGGLMASRSFLRFLNGLGVIKFDEDQSQLDEYLGWTCAALGFYFQFTSGFSVPFPLNLLLWPFQVLETYIKWKIST